MNHGLAEDLIWIIPTRLTLLFPPYHDNIRDNHTTCGIRPATRRKGLLVLSLTSTIRSITFLPLAEMSADIGMLSTAKYGKTKVRVFRIVREEERRHYVVEYNVTVLLEGEIETRYVDVVCVVDRRCS